MCAGGGSTKVKVPKPAPLPPPLPPPPPPKPAPAPPKPLQRADSTPDIRIGAAKERRASTSRPRGSTPVSSTESLSIGSQGLNI